MDRVRSASELPAPPKIKLRRLENGDNNVSDELQNSQKSHSRNSRQSTSTNHSGFESSDRLRKIMKKHKFDVKRGNITEKRTYLGALKFLPHAVYKVLENVPQPWQASHLVPVLYHKSGAITFVDKTPYVSSTEFMAQWGSAWQSMRDEVRDRTEFRRMRLPVFDDDEPMMEYDEMISLVPEIPDPIPLDPYFRPKNSQFANFQAAKPFALNRQPPFLFDHEGFKAAKKLNTQLPNGPMFESQDKVKPVFSSFEDPQRLIVRPRQNPQRVEAQVAYPYIYGHFRENFGNDLLQLDWAVNVVVTRHDNRRAFFVDQSITRVEKEQGSSIESHSAIDVEPFLHEFNLESSFLAEQLALYHAPYPFNQVTSPVRRAEDVPLVKSLYTSRRPLRVMHSDTRRSYQRLLKRSTKLKIQTSKCRHGLGRSKPLITALGSTKFFARTEIDWLEAGMQLIQQGHRILLLLIHRRGLHFMHLDNNFNLKATRTLTTKERKRSRFGNSFHLMRELLKIVKIIVDCHIQFRLGNCDAFQLADALHFVTSNLGQLSGLYRYKYKVIHQITAVNDLKNLIYDRFNAGNLDQGPGCGIWQPAWCVVLGFVRGVMPMLERWLGNLIQRQFFGRVSKGIAKTITKQRFESAYDLELRAAVLHDLLDVIPEQLRRSKTKVIMQHWSEAWRCWKANIPWEVIGMPKPIKVVIDRYIKLRAHHWTKIAQVNRERIRRGKVADKAVARKNLGRITRLWLRSEQERQQQYVREGLFLETDDAVLIFKTMASYLQSTGFGRPINFPNQDYVHDTKLLTLALETLKNEFNMNSRLTNTQRDQLALIENSYDNPHETIHQIKQQLKTQRVFKDIELSLLDFHSHLKPVYHVDMKERIADAYLAQYLSYEAEKRGLWPKWVKPSDDEVLPIMVRKFCSKVNSNKSIWNISDDQASSIVHLKLQHFVDNVDFTLLNQLLRLIVDDSLADYICARMNASLVFKDMAHINHIGVIRGFHFSAFVVQYYLMMIDVLLLGLPRAIELKMKPASEVKHPIQEYVRYIDDVYIALHLSRPEADQLVEEHGGDLSFELPVKLCWPRDLMMRMVRRDVQLGKALIQEFTGRVPEHLGQVKCLDATVYSIDNPALLFEIAGFEVRLTPKLRYLEEGGQDKDALWSLSDDSGERTGVAHLRVSEDSILKFNNRVRQILMSSGSTTFAKIVKRWNTTLIALATYFREAAVETPELLEDIVKNEIRVQNKVKMGLNSKMPARFPPCVFYSPEELGGLGMLSASHVLIPESDLHGTKTRYKFGITEADESLIPNLFRYINSWESEANDSANVWHEYAQKRATAASTNTRILAEDLEELWDRGLPRIATLFQRDRSILAFDKGFRVRQEFANFGSDHFDPFYWTSARHDGRLWNFTSYRNDVVESLGGIASILEHTLFKATGFSDWEGLVWQKQSGFEQQMQMQKLTNAQRSGLSQIPNRRFTLWWSPTINRGNVYIGFQVQLDLTGIFLHGKIPTLKISYIQLFRAHLWQKIHESWVMDMCSVLDKEQAILGIDSVEKLTIHPRKSYRMNASTADILVKSATTLTGWPISKPSSLAFEGDQFASFSSTEFWIDIQLRFGDFDSHDISKYTKSRFLDFTNDGVSIYPCQTGLMVCIDLAYNCCDAYGYWFPGLKQLLRNALTKIMQTNPGLYVLRERLRKALQLHQSTPAQPHLTSSNYAELVELRTIVVDDSAVYRVMSHKTKHGNNTNKPINGALFSVYPATGQLVMNIINAEKAWAGQKKLGSVSKWHSAELVASNLRTLDHEKLPEQIVIATRGLKDPLEVNMLEFGQIKVRNSEMQFPFAALLNLPTFKSLVAECQESFVNADFNLYDNWMEISQPTTAFSRLMLILRALTLAAGETLELLAKWPQYPGFVWPKLSRDEWITLENNLSDLIIDEYGKTNNIDTRTLTQSEIRDIILGQRLTTVGEDRKHFQEESDRISNLDQFTVSENSAGILTKTHNVHGDQIEVVTTSKYEQQVFNSANTWRSRAIECASNLYYKSQNIEIVPSSGGSSVLELPKNLVQEFAQICDVRNLVLGLLYGTKTDTGVRVNSIAVIPQLGSATNVTILLPSYLPDSSGLELVGTIRSQPSPRPENDISPVDLTLMAQRSNLGRLTVTLNITKQGLRLQTFEIQDEGLTWGKSNRDLLSVNPKGYSSAYAITQNLQIINDQGWFYSPEDQIWNFAFMTNQWNPRANAYMKLGIPISYYDSVHRPLHFVNAKKGSGSSELENNFK